MKGAEERLERNDKADYTAQQHPQQQQQERETVLEMCLGGAAKSATGFVAVDPTVACGNAGVHRD